MAKYRVQFTATIPQDLDGDEPVKILGGNLVATVDVETSNASILMEHFQRVLEDIKTNDGLEKYRFEVYAMNGDSIGKMVGLQASDD